MHVKFKEGTQIRLRGNELVSLGNDDLSGLRAVVRSYPGLRIRLQAVQLDGVRSWVAATSVRR